MANIVKISTFDQYCNPVTSAVYSKGLVLIHSWADLISTHILYEGSANIERDNTSVWAPMARD